MLKRHEIEILLKAGHGKAEVARLSGASLRSVMRIAREKPVEHTDDSLERAQPAEYIDVLFWTSYQWGMAFEENSGHPSNTQLREHFTQRR